VLFLIIVYELKSLDLTFDQTAESILFANSKATSSVNCWPWLIASHSRWFSSCI